MATTRVVEESKQLKCRLSKQASKRACEQASQRLELEFFSNSYSIQNLLDIICPVAFLLLLFFAVRLLLQISSSSMSRYMYIFNCLFFKFEIKQLFIFLIHNFVCSSIDDATIIRFFMMCLLYHNSFNGYFKNECS